jgi:hypothetical protein
MKMKEMFQNWGKEQIIICLVLFLCFNFSRIIGDAMLSSGMTFLSAYGVVILLTNVVPLFLIVLGFRKVSPLSAFSVLFTIRFAGTIFADLVIFQAPLELLEIPAYLQDLIIASTLLGIFAAGVALLDRKRNSGLILIGISLVLFFIHVGIMIMPIALGIAAG